ncbi:MAG TPA: hypothetical protein VM261_12870 [Kofleriaceae bacterium]|nr:hypothetical protein [Kofleriaceae bacterium]
MKWLAGALVSLVAACRASAPAAVPSAVPAPAPAKAVAEAAAAWPRCGVLIAYPTSEDADGVALLLPASTAAPEVRRYMVVNQTRHVAPLIVYASWWFCATAGAVVSEPGAMRDEYGTIEVTAFTIDQSTGERGQE